MDLQNFKKLEKEIKKQDFSGSYKGINKLLRVLSYLGNLGSIFLASFFISKLITNSVTALQDSPVAIWGITLGLLVSLELLKRDIFDKFSLEFIRYKNIAKKEVATLAIFALLLISGSFYSSLNGAQEFSSKNEVIETEMVEDISQYTDSLNTVYQVDIDEIELEIDEKEAEIDEYKKSIKEKDDEQALINQSLQDRGYLYNSEKQRNKQLTEEKKELELKIDELELKIDEDEKEIEDLEAERDGKIEDYKAEVNADTSSEKEENKSNSVIFVVISTLIEFLILIGIYFNKNYNFRSYREYKKKMDNNPKFQKWIFYNHVLDTLYMNDLGANDKIPSNKNIHDFIKMGEVWCTEQDVADAVKLFRALKITRTHGPNRFINKEKEDAVEILRNHLKLND